MTNKKQMNKAIPKPKQKNNHARAKRRIKVLLLKNLCKRVMENRAGKIAKLKKLKGVTIVGEAQQQIAEVTQMYKGFYTKGTLNQRQKRKIWRHAPHMRKRA
jgi:hypothetical protein